MKTYALIMVVILTAFGSKAQEFKFKPSGTISETTLVIRNFNSDIVIDGSAEGEVKIMTEDYEGIPEKAKGLKPLSAMGPENTGIGLNVEQKGKEIIVTAASRDASGSDYQFEVPKTMKIKVVTENYNSNDISINGMVNEIEAMSQSGDIIINGVTGPIVAKTVSGDISITFNALNQKFPTSVNSVSGDVDITLRADERGNFLFSSITGEIFTDLDFKIEQNERSKAKPKKDVNIDIDVQSEPAEAEAIREQARELQTHARALVESTRAMTYGIYNDQDFSWVFNGGIGISIKSTLNGGGVDFSINSVSGDIFIRKSK